MSEPPRPPEHAMLDLSKAPLLAMVLATFVVPRLALAEQPQAVAIVAGHRGALAARLSEELRVAGLTVRVEAQATDVIHDGVVLLIGDGDDPSIEVLQKREDKLERVAIVAAGGAVDARILRVTEIVRALALPGGGAGAAPSAPPPASAEPDAPPAAAAPPPLTPAAAAEPPAPRGPRLRTPPPLHELRSPPIFEAGVGAGLGLAAQGPSMSIDATVRLWPHERVGAGLLAILPVIGSRIASIEGEATMRSFLFGAELAFAPVARTDSFGIVLSPGIGFGHVLFSGEAALGYRARDDGVFAGWAYGRMEGRLRLNDSIQATAGLIGGGVFPPVEVRFAGRPVSTYAFTGDVSLGLLLEL